MTAQTMTAPRSAGNTPRGLTRSLDLTEEGLMPQRTRTPQFATHYCACGCGQRPRNYKAQYIAGHRPAKPLADRLWSKIHKTDTGCWEYTGYCRPAGYGQIGRGRTGEGIVDTHRAAWEVTHGPIPEGMVIRHKCDNPPCCNPDHLELGTHQDNVNDAVARGRVARGNRLPQTRLTPGAVADIRRSYAAGQRQRDIAAAYGISQGHVSEIVNGKYWTEVA